MVYPEHHWLLCKSIKHSHSTFLFQICQHIESNHDCEELSHRDFMHPLLTVALPGLL